MHARTRPTSQTEALKRIRKLYAIEAEIRGSPADERLAVRKEQTIPLMQSLYDWIQVQMKVLSRHSGHGEGVRLSTEAVGRVKPVLQQWLGGDRQQYRGERAAWRSPGPENWLFAGSDTGGERAAILYSLIVTCRLNGVDPETWLRYVIGHIQDWPVNRVRDLLPWKVELPSA